MEFEVADPGLEVLYPGLERLAAHDVPTAGADDEILVHQAIDGVGVLWLLPYLAPEVLDDCDTVLRHGGPPVQRSSSGKRPARFVVDSGPTPVSRFSPLDRRRIRRRRRIGLIERVRRASAAIAGERRQALLEGDGPAAAGPIPSPPGAAVIGAPGIDHHGGAWWGTGCKGQHDRDDKTRGFENSHGYLPANDACAWARSRSCARRLGLGRLAGVRARYQQGVAT